MGESISSVYVWRYEIHQRIQESNREERHKELRMPLGRLSQFEVNIPSFGEPWTISSLPHRQRWKYIPIT